MDPTIEALTIHPAAWAALFQGLAEAIAYGLAVLASILVLMVALFGWLGHRPDAEEAPAGPALPRIPSGLASLGPVLLVQHQVRVARRRPRPGCRRRAA